MQTIYHNKANECPPDQHDLIPLMDNDQVVGIVCQRCGKRTFEQKYKPSSCFDRPLVVNELGTLEHEHHTPSPPFEGRDGEGS